MNPVNKVVDYFKKKDKNTKTGEEKTSSGPNKEQKEQIGYILLDELQKQKDYINDESNCIKCRRTRRNQCKKHERMMLGLDALAGKIAQQYVGMKPKYLEDNEQT